MRAREKVMLGDILIESKVESTSPNINSRIRVLLNAKGVIKRPVKKETKDATKYFTRKSGQFIYGKQNIHKGAFGIIPSELDGFESTSDLPAFDVDDCCLPQWLDYFFKQGNYYLSLVNIARGAATKRVQPKELLELEIDLPDITEQKQILSNFQSIETEDAELKHELSHQQILLKKLRQQILQEAIEGKLTKDWRAENPNIEPASELLARIQTEKAQLIQDKKIKKQKSLPAISEEEKPFALPEGWAWCRLGEVVNAYEAGKSFKCVDRQVSNEEWGVLKTSAVTSSFFQELEHKFFQIERPRDITKKVNIGDLIFCRASGSKGLAGKCCLVDSLSKNLLLSDKTPRLLLSEFMEKKYIYFHNETQHTEEYYLRLNTGKSTSMNNITKDQLFEKAIPLPPLQEQKAIVAKVEKLLALCDQLETRITANQAHANALMQAVLKEAFTLDDTQTSEPAQQASANA